MESSRLTLPETGVLLNNGIMWFDPEQGKPNSLGPNKPCLANMCPVMGERRDGFQFALGAAGGRKIIPAVSLLASYIMDKGMDLDEAIHSPRIDVSGVPVVVDESFPHDVKQQFKSAMAEHSDVVEAPRTVYPYNFACPSAVASKDGQHQGVTEIMSFWSDSLSE
ncbi:gamma-glutamyltransferase [Vibrio diabolicus]|nr:gamma-glutamyltransferase [Vibrio diabolicus]